MGIGHDAIGAKPRAIRKGLTMTMLAYLQTIDPNAEAIDLDDTSYDVWGRKNAFLQAMWEPIPIRWRYAFRLTIKGQLLEVRANNPRAIYYYISGAVRSVA